jgi:hypothetical protein
MKHPRRFLPTTPYLREGRIVPSHGGSLGVTLGGRVSPAEVMTAPVIVVNAPQPGMSGRFTANVDNTLGSGLPVYEAVTTRDHGGGTQYEDRLVVPTSPASDLTLEWIQVRDGGGLELVVEHSSWQGNTSQESVTETLPDGETETKGISTVHHGRTSTTDETIDEPAGGGVETIVETEVERPHQSIYHETITTPSGQVEPRKIVENKHSPWRESETQTTHETDGSFDILKTTTTILRLPPPAEIPSTT